MKSDGTISVGHTAEYGSTDWHFLAEIAVLSHLETLTKVVDLRYDLSRLSELIRQGMADSHRPPVDLRQPSIEISCRFISRLLHDNINDHRQLYQSVCHLSAALYLVRPYEVVAILRALGGIIPDPASSNAYLHDILRRDFDTLSVVVNALTVGAFIIASEMAGRGLAYPPDFFNYGSRLGEEYALGQCLGIGKSFEPSEDQEMGRIVAKCYEYCPKFVMKFMGGVRTAYTSMLDGKRYSLGEGISGGLLGHVLMKSFSRTPTPALLNMAFSMST